MTGTSEIIYWDDIKARVCELNAALFQAVEEVDPRKLPISLVKYSYGTTISTDKHYFVPDSRGKLQAHDVRKFPYIFVLDKKLELFVNEEEKLIPRQVYKPGTMFPYNTKTTRVGKLSPRPKSIFTLSSGLRSISILPIYRKNDNYNKLIKTFGLNKNIDPSNPDHHDMIVKSILDTTKPSWYSSVLIFGQEWIKNINENPKWLMLKCFLLEQSINKNAYSKNHFFLDYALIDVIRENNIKITSYTLEILKQMIYIALGDYPGFKPATNNTGLPLTEFLENINGIYQNTPIVIEPTIQSPSSNNAPIYHALMLNASLNRTSFKSAQRLYEISQYIDVLLSGLSEHLLTKTAAYGQLINCLEYNFYSERGDTRGNIKDSLQLLNNDARFLERIKASGNEPQLFEKAFPRRSLFAKALISLQFNKNLEK